MKLAKVFCPRAYLRRLQSIDGRRRYARYFRQITPSREYLASASQTEFKYRPLISIVVPTYNTKPEFFVEMVESVLAQAYQNWELVLVDDASPNANIRQMIEDHAAKDSRIKYKFLKKNHHIAGATNEGFKIVHGEFVSLLDHDDILWPNALYEIAKALNSQPNLDLIYSDEDKVSHNGQRHRDPFLKPDWNSDLLLSMNYITHFTTIRKKIIDKIGGESGEFNGAQDWELFLRATEATTGERIFHIPKILYSWRIHDESTAKSFSAKSYVIDSQSKLLKAALARRGYKESSYELFENSGIWTVKSKNQKLRHGKFDFDKIKGLALNSKEIHKNIGYNSLIQYNYSHAQYDIDGELFTPEEVYRKYWRTLLK